MKARKSAYYMLGIGSLMIFSGIVSSFILDLREDQKLVRQRMVEVTNEFEEFSTSVSLYEEQRDILYDQVLGNFYLETMYNEDVIVKNKLSNYESIVNEIDKKRIILDKLCKNIYYPDSNINSKCGNYKTIYEQVINYFITDINYYNKHIDEYNDYIMLSNSNKLISKYKTNKKYVDYNRDGTYAGKEE